MNAVNFDAGRCYRPTLIVPLGLPLGRIPSNYRQQIYNKTHCLSFPFVGSILAQTSSILSFCKSPMRRMANELTRGIWVWNTTTVLSSESQIGDLIAGTQSIGISDIYLYMAPAFYSSHKAALQSLISNATTAGLRVWGLDGDRAYLDDSAGPENFYAGINNLVYYNCSVVAKERFFGFQADIEPQDDGTHLTFHNDTADSALSIEPGSGKWQSTQVKDREMLMGSWITIYQRARDLLHTQGLRFGAAMPFWTESYCGGEVQADFPGSPGLRQSVMKHMMQLLDEYVVMSYNTSPSNAASRVDVQAAYASTLPAALRPRVFASMELTAGVGPNVSYADTPGKNSKAVVLQDMRIIAETLGHHSAFKGMCFHHWSSWQVMPE